MDGVAMGSPLGPLLADIFVAKLERSKLSQTIEGLAHYSRYMDDIFCVTDRKHDIQQILNLFNEEHPSLEFTVKVETNDILAFLDAAVSRKELTYRSTERKHQVDNIPTSIVSFL
ncbi:unnamed protein product [Echinostoma caproni]|uniref:Reverse transcriptase domain-containing protein n=1 Tax=Echinostoma caproni TaxID=27848 RepID=A0A183B5T0_9TREM|nr:unnamed protein product [Echinostoma caproni]